MRIFLTGATGLVGSAIVQELLGAGHQVLGLARSEASAGALVAAGAQAHRGDLDDLDSLRSGAAASDGVIHTGFNHDFSKFAASCESDKRAIETLGAALEGSDRPLLVTSGLATLASGRLATEEDPAVPPSASYARASEATALELASRGVRAAVIRLPPSVHGEADHSGFIPMLIAKSRENGVSAYVGEGLNCWSAVHQLDAASLYLLALEKSAAGDRFHGVADESVPIRQIAEAIGRGLNVPAVSQTPEEVAEHLAWLSGLLGTDLSASSALTKERLGWVPKQPGLLADLNQGHYFQT